MRISDWSADVCSSDLTPDAIRRDADAALNVCKRHSLASLRAVSSSTRCSDKTLWKSCHKCPGDMVSKSASSCWMRWTSRVSIASHRLRSAATMPSSSVIRVLSGAVNVVRRNAHVAAHPAANAIARRRSEEHTSELQSLMRISYAVFCLKKKKKQNKLQYNKTKQRLTILVQSPTNYYILQ